MDREEALRLLCGGKEGIEEWNRRRPSGNEIPDLRHTNLSGFDLSEANLYKADLRGANLYKANLYKAKLKGTYLHGANLCEANLREVNLNGANFNGANLNGANLYEADLSWANFYEADLRRANLYQANLYKAKLKRTYLHGANLCEANLREANLYRANLNGTDLRWANLCTVNLVDSKLDEADLTGARLWEIQRSGWSIKNIKCEYVFWDRDGEKRAQYALGEFERLYAEKTKIILHYKDGIDPIEVATLPVLIQKLQQEHPGCRLSLQSVQADAGGSTVTIAIDESPKFDDQDVQQGLQEQGLQQKLQEQGNHYQVLFRKRLEDQETIQALQGELDQVNQKFLLPLLKEKYESETSCTPDHKKPLAVMFMDLTGFSKLSQQEREKKIDVLRGLGKPILKHSDGAYHNTWGDAVVAGFEDPTQALTGACKFIVHLNVEGIGARIGMDHGTVRISHNLTLGRLDFDGDAVDVGARLEPLAEPGQVLISKNLRYHPDLDVALFDFTPVKHQFNKAVGNHKAGDAVTCYVAKLRD